jgi:hypothetical protein
MATIVVEFAKMGEYRGQAAMPFFLADVTSEEIATSGTSQATTAAAAEGDFVSILNTHSSQNVWIQIGQSPTAAVEQDIALLSGERRYFGPLAAGDKVAVINDS